MLVFRIRLPERRGVASRTLSVGINKDEPKEEEIEDLKSEVSKEYSGEIGDVIRVKLTDLDHDGDVIGNDEEEEFILTRTLAPRDHNHVGVEVLRESDQPANPLDATLAGAGEFSKTEEDVEVQDEVYDDVPDDADDTDETDPN